MMPNNLPEFSKEGYADVLNRAINKGYYFIPFSEKNNTSQGKYCLMRHDIDTSLKCALEIASIENRLGIVSTFFFMLRSPGYNLFGRFAYDVINQVKKMGHEIALHFDAAHPAVTGQDLISAVLKEVNILSDLVSHNINTVSFHQPSSEILNGNILIPGILNTYNKQQMEGWYYTSDSNRVWKEHNAYSVFSSGEFDKIQILTHPIWWVYNDPLIEDAWDNAVMDNFYLMQQQFLDTEGAYGNARKFNIIRDK